MVDVESVKKRWLSEGLLEPTKMLYERQSCDLPRSVRGDSESENEVIGCYIAQPTLTYSQYSALPQLTEHRALFKDSAKKKQGEKTVN